MLYATEHMTMRSYPLFPKIICIDLLLADTIYKGLTTSASKNVYTQAVLHVDPVSSQRAFFIHECFLHIKHIQLLL